MVSPGPITCWRYFTARTNVILNLYVKLGVRMEMSGLKSCEALASTYRLRHSLDGCLKFRRSRRSRRVWSRAEKKLKKGESELRRSRLLS